MQELIERLKQHAGLTEAQAEKAIEVVKAFTKEKFPMFEGAIDAFFEESAGGKEDYLD
jgi:hypothetical protein